MKTITTLVFIIVCTLSINAQNTYIKFTYDAAGNRTGRQIVIAPINETDSVVNDSNQAASLISEVINMGDGCRLRVMGHRLQLTGYRI